MLVSICLVVMWLLMLVCSEWIGLGKCVVICVMCLLMGVSRFCILCLLVMVLVIMGVIWMLVCLVIVVVIVVFFGVLWLFLFFLCLGLLWFGVVLAGVFLL